MDFPFDIDPASADTKHAQIVDGVIAAINEGALSRGDALPSITAICSRFGVARDTVVKAYGELKRQGVVEARLRKGYFVATDSVQQKLRVFVMFDEFTAYKQIMYNAFMERIGGAGHVEIFFHHYNPDVFTSILIDNVDRYHRFVVMPFANPKVDSALQAVRHDRLLLLDRNSHTTGEYRYLCQDFAQAVEDCLSEARQMLAKFEHVTLVFRKEGYRPKEITSAFRRFCRRHQIAHAVVDNLRDHCVRKGEAFFVIEDEDLVYIVEAAMRSGLVLGTDIGLLSYNEEPMKTIVAGGVTVISTDFAELGRKAAECALNQTEIHETHPTRLIMRNTL